MDILKTYQSKNEENITQIMAYKDDQLLIEKYYHGFTRNMTMNVMSVTKSIHQPVMSSITMHIRMIKPFIYVLVRYKKEKYYERKTRFSVVSSPYNAHIL